ncbi:hypothetical protein SDC9_43048 [bioreactor metagenome]|uniref:Uncharacterized protein n=1 Tax=bioreactor metagenome TaxID=1076179 RepID=A0A644VZD9_9ZZZZ
MAPPDPLPLPSGHHSKQGRGLGVVDENIVRLFQAVLQPFGVPVICFRVGGDLSVGKASRHPLEGIVQHFRAGEKRFVPFDDFPGNVKAELPGQGDHGGEDFRHSASFPCGVHMDDLLSPESFRYGQKAVHGMEADDFAVLLQHVGHHFFPPFRNPFSRMETICPFSSPREKR